MRRAQATIVIRLEAPARVADETSRALRRRSSTNVRASNRSSLRAPLLPVDGRLVEDIDRFRVDLIEHEIQARPSRTWRYEAGSAQELRCIADDLGSFVEQTMVVSDVYAEWP